jgi:hypothetical protein
VNFGKINITKNDPAALVAVADPSDPSIYIHYGNYSIEGSLHGMIPFAPNTAPSPANASLGKPFFGHIFAHGDFPLAGLPITIGGDVTVNLDANADGNWLGSQGSASDLYAGNLTTTLTNAAKDIIVGVNGEVDAGYKLAGFNFTVPLGQGALEYNGPSNSFWFKGGSTDPLAGTPLAPFQATQTQQVEGSYQRKGPTTAYSIAITNSAVVFGQHASMTFTLNNSGIHALGVIHALGTNVNLTGDILTNGNWDLKGTASLGFSAFGGSGSFEFKHTGATHSFTASIEGHANWTVTIAGTKWGTTASIGASLTITVSGGSLHYNGTATAKGKVTSPIGSVGYSLSVGINNNKMTFGIPKIGTKTISLPL